ncbi:MAG: hypothetical protein HY899_04550 [Deltaproteobacteria bacterium]|nr:hypothetical protein [Deltaproteobacteria bacterium]
MSLVVKNFTGALQRGESFLRAKCALVATEGLSIHIKHTSARGRDINGYYRLRDRRMVLAVKRRLRYPRVAAYGIGTVPAPRRRLGSAPFRVVWFEERFTSPDDLLVFVAGHELWHFLCHSEQRRRDHETKANCNGFLWLREFRHWRGPPHPVAAIPLLPPRPDAVVVDSAAAEPLQLDLFAQEPGLRQGSSRPARGQ